MGAAILNLSWRPVKNKMAAPLSKNVDLGFVEETDDLWRLESHYFPSKVGGRPSWLALDQLPTGDQLKCDVCEKSLIFLLQIYAPLSDLETGDADPNAFHRTLFLFCCRTPSCGTKNMFKVFRSQLAHLNKFYNEKPPPEMFDEALKRPNARDYQSICAVCGCPGSKHCGQCKKVNYCSREHQTMDWKHGHKTSCLKSDEVDFDKPNPLLFPALELVMESEPAEETPEKTEEEALEEYDEFMREKGQSMSTSKVEDLETMATGEQDKKFKQFKKRISREPEQVLRYERGGQPLWVSEHGIPGTGDIPSCRCGAERQFEFQVLPQLLTHLDVTRVDASLDWGTLVVYTCSRNCHQGDTNYSQEIVWRQEFSQ